MDIIPVLDLARGIAVHARTGDRRRYRPVRSVLTPGAEGDPVALLRAYREVLGATTCYVADLDAIQGAAVQRTLLRELALLERGAGGALLVDAGSGDSTAAHEVLSCGARSVVVGLESLHAFADLEAIVESIGGSRVVFSLDLRLGAPILHPMMQDAARVMPDAVGVAGRAVAAGAETLILLDIGRVGTGCGADLGLLETLRRRFRSARLWVGGGVLTRRDLQRVRDAGGDGVLLASALHAGRIGAEDLAALA